MSFTTKGFPLCIELNNQSKKKKKDIITIINNIIKVSGMYPWQPLHTVSLITISLNATRSNNTSTKCFLLQVIDLDPGMYNAHSSQQKQACRKWQNIHATKTYFIMCGMQKSSKQITNIWLDLEWSGSDSQNQCRLTDLKATSKNTECKLNQTI